MSKKQTIRLRFAPSPTGAGMHMGGVRTALYNYLFAKKHGGDFILRIEDTDQERYVSTAEKQYTDTFKWLGIDFDESPEKGGNYGPYRQSERKNIYLPYAIQLVKSGHAYYSFDTSDELNEVKNNDKYFSYNYTTRMKMKNSLTLPKDEIDMLLSTRNDWTIRIKYPDKPINIEFDDDIRGHISFMSSELDDKVIYKKKDELPTYHLANVVDDHLMEITHINRGEEWLPSTPLHIYLYNCFGWDAPKFAHLPLILGPDGSKLSKRDGIKYGFPVFVLECTDPKTFNYSSGFRENGYTPDAVINLLAFLGWNPGTNKEVYTMDELIQDFDIKRVNKSGAKFNPDKAAWFNGQHLKNLSTNEFVDEFKKDLNSRGIKKDDNFINRVIEENKSKVNFIKDLYNVVNYLFEKPTDFDKKSTKKWNDKSHNIINGFIDNISTIDKWEEKEIQSIFEKYVEDSNIKFGQIAPLVRVLLSGKSNGPSMFGIMELLGKEETLDRLSNLDIFGNTPDVETGGVDNTTKEKITQTEKELDTIKKLITSSEKKLNNKNFLERAPESVVQKEKEKIIEFKNRVLVLTNELDKLR